MKHELQEFTVILMYPDYYSDPFGETWCGHVKADNAVQAVERAKVKCCSENTFNMPPDDLLPVSVFEGELEDLIGQWCAAQSNPPPQVRSA